MMEFTFDGIVRHGFGFYNPNHAAALICAIFPFLWGWKKYAPIGWIATCLLAVPLALTYSRTGVLVLLLELTAYFILSKSKSWKGLAAAVGGILLVFAVVGVFGRFVPDRAATNRPAIWLAGLKLYAANPFGVGLGNSGTLVSNFMLPEIRCRTLVNSHLTLLAEFGVVAGFLWFMMIFYALSRGVRKIRSWCAAAGLGISAFCASVFDWDLLTDFRDFGNLPMLNFLLSWLLLIVFLALILYLVIGKLDFKKLGIAAGAAALCVILPLGMRDARTPNVVAGGIVRTSPEAPLVLYDEEWSIKSLLRYCGNDFQIPLRPGFLRGTASEIILFGNAAEFAHEFPQSRITYIHPPEFFEPGPNTVRIVHPKHDSREFPFEVQRN